MVTEEELKKHVEQARAALETECTRYESLVAPTGADFEAVLTATENLQEAESNLRLYLVGVDLAKLEQDAASADWRGMVQDLRHGG